MCLWTKNKLKKYTSPLFFYVSLLKSHDISRSVKISLAEGQVQTCFEGLQSLTGPVVLVLVQFPGDCLIIQG